MSESWVTVKLPAASWRQIVSNIEDMCGTGAEEIEILQEAQVSDEWKSDANL